MTKVRSTVEDDVELLHGAAAMPSQALDAARDRVLKAVREMRDSRDIIDTAGANLHIDVDRPQDLITHIELLRDELARANAHLMLVRDFVAEERGKRDNYNRQQQGKGGQTVGDSHSPRLPISTLLELERMLKDGQGAWIVKGLREQAEAHVALLRPVIDHLSDGHNCGICYDLYKKLSGIK